MVVERFAARLRELRQEAGLSQQQLAGKAGMTKDGIAHLEQGRRSPSWGTVLALCAALGVDCTTFTITPKDAAAPERGRPRKADASADKPAASKRAPKSRKRKK